MLKIVVIFGFLIAFAAGLVVGMQKPGKPPTAAENTTTRPTTQPRGFLPAALNLTAQQQEAMKKIWSEGPVMNRGEQDKRRRQCRDERDEAIAAIFTPETKAKYDEIQKSYREKSDAIDHEMREDFQKRVELTKEILTSEQRTKYDELLARRGGPGGGNFDRGPGDRGDRGRNRRGPGDGATSQTRPEH